MIHWFKKHPEHLRRESNALATDGNYKELFQKRKEFFVSHGNILVRLNGIQRHPILIVYPSSTPYSIPTIYPLTRELTEAEVENVAEGNISQSFIKQFYQYRHQNGSGAL